MNMNINTSNINRYEHIKCPVCNGEYPMFDFFTHLYISHEAFLAAWTSLAFPVLHENNVVDNADNLTDFFRTLGIRDQSFYGGFPRDEIAQEQYTDTDPDQEPDLFDQLSYEQLMSICDEVGYHKVGIKDVDTVAPAIVRMKKIMGNSIDDRCPICLDNMHQAVYMREIKECKHTFCGECIEEWLVENKTCPLCKLELSEPNVTNEEIPTPSSDEDSDIVNENDNDNEFELELETQLV